MSSTKKQRTSKFAEVDELFHYDPKQTYCFDDFHKLSILKLQRIASGLQVRRVKGYKKEHLIPVMIQKHEEQRSCSTSGIEESKTEEINPTSFLTDLLKQKFSTILHYKYKNDVWFRASKVANYLEYENPKKAVNDHVSSEDKVLFGEISSQGYPNQVPFEEFHRDTVYINKYGIFDLITKSRMPLARQFRKWLVEEILPSILGTGVYVSPVLTESQLMEFQAKIQQIEKEKQQLQLRLESEQQIRLNKINRNQIQNSIPLEELYILTSKQYARDYIYKIGKSNNTSKRLNSLNTSRVKDEELYICHRAKCYDANSAEIHLHTLLNRYRLQNSREFFVMQFEDIRTLMDHVCQNFNVDYEKCMSIITDSQNRPCPETNVNIPAPYPTLIQNENLKSVSGTNVITNYYNTKAL